MENIPKSSTKTTILKTKAKRLKELLHYEYNENIARLFVIKILNSRNYMTSSIENTAETITRFFTLKPQ